MPIQTDLSVAPYFDDFNESKNYHKILFRPGVAVQTREVNQLQTILQNQIERFGDNVFTKGTIISGCNFQYYSYYPYVKIRDLQTNDLLPVTLGNYVGLYTKNSSNLVSQILTANAGYESLSPDLNTLFVRYLNSGNTGTANSYSADDVLTIYDANTSIFKVVVPVGGTGQGFSNSDVMVFMPSMTMNHSVNVGDTINDPVSKANGVVVSINTTAIVGSNVVSVRPYANALTNNSISNTAWTFNTGNTVLINNSVSSSIVSIVGSGAAAVPVTDGVGKVNDVLMVTQGNGYIVPPYVTIKTANTTANVATSAISLTAQNYLATVTVANTTLSGNSTPTGSGFAFGVSEGVIYQKGYFLYVNSQTTVVSKYTNAPDSLSVGFNTSESIINSNIDNTLLDNASGSLNYQAPGADRLQLTPQLTVLSSSDAEANTEFFEITAFTLGQPYLQNQETSYSKIGDEMAKRTYESAGDYVLDNFVLSTKTAANTVDENGSFRVVIDPGKAYISGQRVNTRQNYSLVIDQGIDSKTVPSATINLNYGNYITVNELGGTFDCTLGDLVTFYDTAKQFLTSTANFSGDDLTVVGSALGTARIRSVVLVSGVAGTASAQYYMYLYDVTMFAGFNFKNVKSVRYTNAGTGRTGVADLVLIQDPTTSAYIASIANTSGSTMLFNVGSQATHATANIDYIYKTIKTGNTAGTVQVQLAGNEYFQYTPNASLSADQLINFNLVFTANAQASANATGYVRVQSTSNNWIIANSASATPNFITTFSAGDYIKVFSNATHSEVRRIDAVVNSTVIQVNSNTTIANGQANIVQFYPKDVQVPLSVHSRSANIDTTGQLLTINLNGTLAANTTYNLTTNIQVVSATPATKTSNRDTTVKINFANNSSGNNTSGPWALGKPDIFRLKKVYLGVNTAILAANTLTYTNSSFTDVTNDFYIDHNQNLDYYDYGYLYLKPKSSLALANSQGLVVQFDHFSNSVAGFYTIDSYPIDDTKTYTQLNATKTGGKINTNEIPELYTTSGGYVDIINTVDFRTRVISTANTTAGNVDISTTNPSVGNANTRFGSSASLSAVGFPDPDSRYISDLSHYLGRVDRIVIDKKGRIKAIKGTPSTNDTLSAPAQPADTMTINLLYIPPYPNIPQGKSNNLVTILDKGIANEKFSVQRDANHAITVPLLGQDQIKQYQPNRYSMKDIQNLETRIRTLENQAALSQLEQQVKDLTIPSSIDPTMNRFKYGFFADSFKDPNYSDVQNPEYAASVINNEVVAKQAYTNFEFDFLTGDGVTGKFLTLPYSATEKRLTGQASATSGPIIVYPAAGTVLSDYCDTSYGWHNIVADGNGGSTDLLVEAKSVSHCNYKATANTTPTQTYPARGTYVSEYCDYSDHSKHVVRNDGTGGTYEDVTANSVECGYVVPPQPPTNYVGSLSSDPQTFTLETSSSSDTQWYYNYYWDGYWYSDYYNGYNYNNYGYGYGSGSGWDYNYYGYYYPQEYTTTTYYFASSQTFNFTATGLKPSTLHTFTFDGADQSSQCTSLVSGADGTLNFSFTYNSGLDSASTDYSSSQSKVNNLAGPKTASISASGSTASTTITFVAGSDFTAQPAVTQVAPANPVVVTPDVSSYDTQIEWSYNYNEYGDYYSNYYW